MKAFNKNGKSCLCQVPKNQRRTTLPSEGCKYCGCSGCNPIDIRKDKRNDLKKQFKDGKYKKKRFLDSDDEELRMDTEYDTWHKKRAQLFKLLEKNFKPFELGLGLPIRTPAYILGIHKKWIEEEEYRRRNED